MIGVAMSASYRLRFSTTLAKIEHSDWSAPTALFDNTWDDGIDDRTSERKVWEQTLVTTRLVVSYFNWIWQHSRFKSSAALACRINISILDLERYRDLSHNNLTHYQPIKPPMVKSLFIATFINAQDYR